MEQESFFTGYCRCADQSRTVTAVTEDGKLIEVDCCYESCIHTSSCTIAQALEERIKER